MALLLACLVALAPAALIGWQVLDGVREHFGRAFADNFTQLNRQRILAPVSRELALSQRLADSEVTRRWLRNENDPAARELFFREADGYRRDLLGGAYFIASAASGNYYFNDDKPLSETPRYTLSPSAADDGWFYATIKSSARYNINVNPDLKLQTTKVWINVQIRDGEKVMGLTGAGLDVGGFLKEFVNSGQPGVTPIIVDEEGAIQAHMNPALIAYNSGAGGASGEGMVFSLLDDGEGRAELLSAMHAAQADPQSVQSAWVKMDGVRQLVSVAYMPELHWHVLTVVDLGAARQHRRALRQKGDLPLQGPLLAIRCRNRTQNRARTQTVRPVHRVARGEFLEQRPRRHHGHHARCDGLQLPNRGIAYGFGRLGVNPEPHRRFGDVVLRNPLQDHEVMKIEFVDVLLEIDCHRRTRNVRLSWGVATCLDLPSQILQPGRPKMPSKLSQTTRSTGSIPQRTNVCVH